jgi:hypothetical protein
MTPRLHARAHRPRPRGHHHDRGIGRLHAGCLCRLHPVRRRARTAEARPLLARPGLQLRRLEDDLHPGVLYREVLESASGGDPATPHRGGRALQEPAGGHQQFPAADPDVLRPVFGARPRGYWSERLTAHDVPNAPVHSTPEPMQDPEVRHLKLFHQMEHPRYASLTALERPLRLNGERESDPLPPPALGEHTESVLQELGIRAVGDGGIAQRKDSLRRRGGPSSAHLATACGHCLAQA